MESPSLEEENIMMYANLFRLEKIKQEISLD